MSKPFHNLKIGLLGGGQLGRMLLQKAADFSLDIKVLDPDPAAPCRQICNDFTSGSFSDYDTVYAFGKSCDLVTIEIEHVNADALQKLSDEGINVFPQPNIIKLVQDKGEQKLFFRKNNIPTSDFQLVENREELTKMNLKFPKMQKLRKGGYDGRGVFRISNERDFESAFDEPSVIEELISFQKEISVIVARNENGDCETFPVTSMEFNPEANLVEFLFAPADISNEEEKLASNIAKEVATRLEIIGLLAVEMFLTKDGKILVNEIAPRPHNSGHHTIEATTISQYEQHLRAILGLKLIRPETIRPAVMLNLLGEKNYDGPVFYKNLDKVLEMENTYIHLYGKKFTRPFRKMGHITVLGKNLEEAKQKAIEIKQIVKVIST